MWDNLPERNSCEMQGCVLRAINSAGVFPERRHFPFASKRLSKMSFPPTAILCHLKPEAASVHHQLSKKCLILNVFGVKDILRSHLSLKLFHFYRRPYQIPLKKADSGYWIEDRLTLFQINSKNNHLKKKKKNISDLKG